MTPSSSVYKISIGIIMDLILEGFRLIDKCIQLCLHGCIGVVGVIQFVDMMVGCCIRLVLVYLHLRHHLIYNGIGVVLIQSFNCSSYFAGF